MVIDTEAFLWLCGIVGGFYTLYRAVKEVSKDIKTPLKDANEKINDHEKRLKKLEYSNGDLWEELKDQKAMMVLILEIVSALARDDKEAIADTSAKIDNFLRNNI